MVYFFHFSSFLGENIFKIELFMILVLVLLDVKANLPETSPFFICPNGCAEQLSSSPYDTWNV